MSPRACLLSLTLVAACTPPPPEGPHLLYSTDAQSLDNPFPDARLVRDGKLALRAGWYTPFLAPKAMTGKAKTLFNNTGAAVERDVTSFGNFGAVLLRASVPLDASSVKGHVARVAFAADGGASVLERDVVVQHSSQFLTDASLPLHPEFPEFLFIRPSVSLPEGTDGALVVLKGVLGADGAALERGREFGAESTASPSRLKAVAAALGVAEADVLLVLPQRGQPTTQPMATLAAWAQAHPGAATIPTKGTMNDSNGQRPVGAWASTDSDWLTLAPWMERHGFGRPATHPGRVIIGQFSAFDLRDEAGHFVASSVADPSTARAVPLWFVLVLPKGDKPAGGWKVVMGQHGVGGRNTPRVGVDDAFCLEWAEALTAQGLGCIGIDAPSHGTRGAFTDFFSVDDLPALRDRFREMTFDLLQEERFLATLDVDGDGTPDLDPNARYLGNSLGSIIGANFVPFANHLTSAVLNVPGGGLGNIIASPNIHDLLGLLFVSKTDIAFGSAEYETSFPLLRTVAQALLEVGDPVNSISRTPATRAVLIQLGKGDVTIPNDTTEDLAHALGATVVTGAVSGTTPLHVLSRIDPAKYLPSSQVAAYNGHDIVWDFAAPRAMVLEFLRSDGQALSAP